MGSQSRHRLSQTQRLEATVELRSKDGQGGPPGCGGRGGLRVRLKVGARRPRMTGAFYMCLGKTGATSIMGWDVNAGLPRSVGADSAMSEVHLSHEHFNPPLIPPESTARTPNAAQDGLHRAGEHRLGEPEGGERARDYGVLLKIVNHAVLGHGHHSPYILLWFSLFMCS